MSSGEKTKKQKMDFRARLNSWSVDEMKSQGKGYFVGMLLVLAIVLVLAWALNGMAMTELQIHNMENLVILVAGLGTLIAFNAYIFALTLTRWLRIRNRLSKQSG